MPADLNPADVVLLHRFDGSLVPAVGGPFAADGGVTFTEINAKFGQSVSINGTNPGGGGSNVVYSATDSAAYDINDTDFTIEGWIYYASDPTRPRTLIKVQGSDGADEYHLFSDGFPDTFFAASPSGPGQNDYQSRNLGTAVAVGVWTHLAMSRQGDVYRAFVNGVLRDSWNHSYRKTAGAKNVFIGAPRLAFVDAHHGLIDEVLIVRKCLYTASFTPSSQPSSLLEIWPGRCDAWPAGDKFR